MMDVRKMCEKAGNCHGENMNCAQSVLCGLSEITGLDDESARCVAAGFGGGMRCGSICGAVSGAIMAIGLAKGHDDVRCGKPQSEVSELTKSLISEFKEKYGYINCADLLRSTNGQKKCSEYIDFCVTAVASLLENK